MAGKLTFAKVASTSAEIALADESAGKQDGEWIKTFPSMP
jgi:hypothetical protein